MFSRSGAFMKRAIVSLDLLLSVLFALLLPMTASAQKDANVKAVLFYSPTCPHCHLVISETLPPLWQTYGGSIDIYRSAAATEEEAAEPPFVAFLGEQLSVLYVDVATQEGSEFFTAALDAFDLPETEGYVPTMFIDDLRLVGSGDIPAQLPGLIANGLENGGIDWPALPGIDQILSGLAFETTVLAEATPAAAGAENPEEAAAIDIETGSSVIERFKQDPLANSISVVVLLGMLVSLGFVFTSLRNPPIQRSPVPLHWAILPLLIAGIAVAGYLFYVESSGTEAVCGPVGDCNTVQNSSYAVFLGIIPIGMMGIIGYIAILIAWAMTRIFSDRISDYGLMAIFTMAMFGTLFSIYLTFLEPFVIGASCAWCLASAVLMTAILVMSAKPAAHAYARIRKAITKRN
jgi:uncharacterized membrane protein